MFRLCGKTRDILIYRCMIFPMSKKLHTALLFCQYKCTLPNNKILLFPCGEKKLDLLDYLQFSKLSIFSRLSIFKLYH